MVPPPAWGWAAWKKPAVSVFILLYLYQAGLLAMAFPPEKPSDLTEILLKPIMPIICSLGIYHHQKWFAPNPVRVLSRVGVEVSYADGQFVPWWFSRRQMLWLDPPNSYERYAIRYILKARQQKEAFQDLLRYIARVNSTPGQPPVAVRMFKSWGKIPLPTDGSPNPLFVYDHMRTMVTWPTDERLGAPGTGTPPSVPLEGDTPDAPSELRSQPLETEPVSQDEP